MYPSSLCPSLRVPYRIATVIGMFVPVLVCGCTTLWTTTGGYFKGLPVIMYGGVMPPVPVMLAGIGLWSIGVWLFITPWWVGSHILGIGGFNLLLLIVFDGTIQLVSKLCFYCLLLSIMWALEPLYEPALTRWQQRKSTTEPAIEEGSNTATITELNGKVQVPSPLAPVGTVPSPVFYYVPMQAMPMAPLNKQLSQTAATVQGMV